jgi:2,5-diketo-D-gluconate reductase A
MQVAAVLDDVPGHGRAGHQRPSTAWDGGRPAESSGHEDVNSTVDVPAVTLNNGVEMPQIGFGVFRVPDDQTRSAVLAAIEAGYRSIDTASLYGNEVGVGRAVESCGLPRADLFVTTKVWNDDQGYQSTLEAFDESLTRLGLDYVDLYLIHWPMPAKSLYVETWRALEEIHRSGRARAIGVSNFQPWHLQPVLDQCAVVPAVNQVELHPLLQQEQVRAFDRAHDIVTEAWSPLARGEVLTDPVISRLSRTYGKTPAQIVLRWHVELGIVVIPKSVTPARIKENIDIFDFELTPDDLAAIRGLDRGARTGPDPDGGAKPPGFSSTGGRWTSEGGSQPGGPGS